MGHSYVELIESIFTNISSYYPMSLLFTQTGVTEIIL